MTLNPNPLPGPHGTADVPAAPPACDGVILFAHGARDPAWARPFDAVAASLRTRRPGLPVRTAFLEFMAPDLPAAGDELAQMGCRRVCIVPLFLGAGGHVRKDLPGLVEGLRARHPATAWELSAAIGEVASVIDAMADAALTLAAATGPGPVPGGTAA